MKSIIKTNTDKKSSRILAFVFLHFCVFVYALQNLASKCASGYPFLSKEYIFFIFLTLLGLGVYAVLWQQAIKPFRLSVAYPQKSASIVWVLLFSHFIFQESITVGNIIGSVLLIGGIALVASCND